MVQTSTSPSLLRCAWVAALIAGLFVPAVALVGSDKTEPKAERSTTDEPQARKENRYKLSVFLGVPHKESVAKDEKSVFETLVTANKPFDFKVKEGLGASGVLRYDKEGKLHFKGQVNFSPTIGVFDLPVELGKGYRNRSGFSSGGILSFFVKFEQAESDNGQKDNSDSPDAEALIFEMQSQSGDGLAKLEVMIARGSDFRVSSSVDRVKWTLYGSVEKVVDGVVTIRYSIQRGNSAEQTLANREFKIDDLENFAWAGVWGGSTMSRSWIRRGVDPVPVVNRILARRDKSFGVAAHYLTELEPMAQSAALPQLIDTLNDGIDNSERPAYDSLRASAAQTLGKFGPTAKAAVPALVQRLKDENAYVRVDAATALWRIEQHPAAVPALITELKNEDRNIRSRAVGNLGDIADAENSSVVIPALISTFKNDEHAHVRRQAAYALATTGDFAKSAVPALKSALNNAHDEVRHAASHAIEVILGREQDSNAAPPEHQKDSALPASPDPFEGASSEEASPNPFDDVSPNTEPQQLSAVDALSRALHNKNENVQRAAARRLERIARRSAKQRDRVSYDLATYNMKKEEWASALRWWHVYTPPRSCVELWPSYKNDCIATCLLRSGKLDEACDTIFETGDVARNRIPELVDAYRLQGNLPNFERYLTGLQSRDAEPEKDEQRREIVKRVAIAREYMEMLRMADRGDVAGLWEKLDVSWWDHVGPPYDFDPPKHAENLLLSIGEKANPLLLAKLKSGLPDENPTAAIDSKQFTEQYFQRVQARAERQTAILLLGRLKATETLPFIRSEFVKKDLDQYFATACFRAALHLGTDEAVSFVIDCATNPKYRIYHQTAREVLVDFKEDQGRKQRVDDKNSGRGAKMETEARPGAKTSAILWQTTTATDDGKAAEEAARLLMRQYRSKIDGTRPPEARPKQIRKVGDSWVADIDTTNLPGGYPEQIVVEVFGTGGHTRRPKR